MIVIIALLAYFIFDYKRKKQELNKLRREQYLENKRRFNEYDDDEESGPGETHKKHKVVKQNESVTLKPLTIDSPSKRRNSGRNHLRAPKQSSSKQRSRGSKSSRRNQSPETEMRSSAAVIQYDERHNNNSSHLAGYRPTQSPLERASQAN